MSSVLVKYVPLWLQNLTSNKTDRKVDVDAVRLRKKIDPETRKATDEIEGYNLDFIGVKGGIQTVKLPLEVAATIEKIDAALKNGSIVRVNFGNPSTLRARFYSMVQNGQHLQGISATADKVEIVDIEEVEAIDFDDEVIL